MDPSNSFESQAFDNANQLEQTETITCMDRNSYNAAAEGKIVVIKDITDQSLDLLLTPNEKKVIHIYIKTLNSGSESTNQPSSSSESQTEPITCMHCDSYNAAAKGDIFFFLDAKSDLQHLRTLNKNTILHIYITAFDSGAGFRSNFVEKILEMCPSLSQQANAKGETPLHIAARYGHYDIVKVLIEDSAKTPRDADLEGGIERVKEMLRVTNKEKDTALHEAVRYNHLEVVKLLISKDPNFSYSANDAGETPLYIAAERGLKQVLSAILKKCKSPMHGGPLGRTALHVAVIRKSIDMTKALLEAIEGLSREVDSNRWTPLHFAAYLDHFDVVNLLLDKDQHRSNVVSVPYSTAYMKNKEGRTPLHIAAQRGHVRIVKSIVLRFPDCCEVVDNRGWNVLHYAMKADFPDDVIGFILENSSLSNLLNEKNDDGDTPLHFYSNSRALAIDFVNHLRVDKMAFNKENLSAYELASTNSKLQVKMLLGCRYAQPLRVITCEDDTPKAENQEATNIGRIQKLADNSLIVAALITTVTFAACISMPGGFMGEDGSHPGSALLRKNIAFKAFVITNTISMALSSTAVCINLVAPIFFNLDAEDRDFYIKLSLKFIMGAVVAMGLAFVTGTYAVLAPSLNLAIANCIFGLTFFAFLFHVYGKFVWTCSKRLNRVTNVKYE